MGKRCILSLVLSALVSGIGATEATAQELATRARGLGSTAGRGALHVRLTLDDPTGRVKRIWLIAEADCAFASKKWREVLLRSDSVSDLNTARECNLTRSWLCMEVTAKYATELKAEGRETNTIELLAGYTFLVTERGMGFPIANTRGRLPHPGREVLAVVSQSRLGEFRFEGEDFELRTARNQMCLADGTDRFFQMYDPALNRQ